MKKLPETVSGSVVESTSGGDTGKLYIVIGFEKNGYLILCDGRRHKLTKPKRKNAKHVAHTGKNIAVPKTDAAVVTAIRRNKK